MFRKTVYFLKCIYNYFYDQVLLVCFFCIIAIYYLGCLVSRHYIDADICAKSLIDQEYYIGLFDETREENSLAQLGCINKQIKEKKYKKAIELINCFIKSLDINSKLSKIMNIRKAILYMFISNNLIEYQRILKSKFNFNQVLFNTLTSIYEKNFSIKIVENE